MDYDSFDNEAPINSTRNADWISNFGSTIVGGATASLVHAGASIWNSLVPFSMNFRCVYGHQIVDYFPGTFKVDRLLLRPGNHIDSLF